MAIVLALISALVYGVSDYSGGRATRLAPVFLVSLVGQLAAMAGVLVLLRILGDPIPGSSDIGWSAAAGLAGVLGVSAFYYALANGAMTVVAPVTAIVSAVLPVGVGLADGEQPGALAVVGVVIAVLAVALVSGALEEHERPTSRRVLLIAVAAGIGFGLLFVFFDRTGDDAGAWPLLISQLVSIPLLATGVWRTGGDRVDAVPSWWIIAAIAGLLSVGANMAYLAATREGLLTIVSVVTAMYPASTVLLATALDGERIHRTQAYGLALAVAALALVAAGR